MPAEDATVEVESCARGVRVLVAGNRAFIHDEPVAIPIAGDAIEVHHVFEVEVVSDLNGVVRRLRFRGRGMLLHKITEPVWHQDRLNVPGGLVVVAIRVKAASTDKILVAGAKRKPFTAVWEVD